MCRCWAVATTTGLNSDGMEARARTTGAIFTASGRVPKTAITIRRADVRSAPLTPMLVAAGFDDMVAGRRGHRPGGSARRGGRGARRRLQIRGGGYGRRGNGRRY